MQYTPVAKRGGISTSSYTPVAERVAPAPAEKINITAPDVFEPIAKSTSPTKVDLGNSSLPGTLIQSTLQAGPRAGATLVETGKELITKQPESITPNDPISRFVLGSDAIPSLQTNIKTTQEEQEAAGLPRALAKPFGAFTAVGSLGLDLAPLGEEKGALNAITKVKDISEAAAIARKINVADDLIDTAAAAFVKAKTPEDAKAAIASIENLQKTTKKAYTPVAARTEILKTAPAIPKELASLAEEARKYKSAEEFVKTQVIKDGQDSLVPSVTRKEIRDTIVGQAKKDGVPINSDGTITLYHGTPFSKEIETSGKFNQGTYFSSDRTAVAKQYTGQSGPKGTIIETKVDPADVFYNGDGVFVARTGDIKLTSQLTDLYEKATKVEKPGATLPKTAAENAAEVDAYAQRNLTRRAGPGNAPLLPRKLSLSSAADEAFNAPGIIKAKQEIENLKVEKEIGNDVTSNMPGKALQKYESRSTGELPEITGQKKTNAMSGSGKKVKTSKFGQSGDVIMHELGFDTAEDAQKALDDYKEMRAQTKATTSAIRDKVAKYNDRKAVFDELVRYVKAQGNARREKIRAVSDFFNFDSADLKEVMKGEGNFMLMSDKEFGDFMDRMEKKSIENYLRSKELIELQSTIFEKEFVKLSNLQEALKLPRIENMKPEQMHEFNKLLESFNHGDEFLGVRQLQTLKNTDLKGIHTMREAQERLLADVNGQRARQGLEPVTLSDLQSTKVNWRDKFRYDVALARQNPLYEEMVRETFKANLTADAASIETREHANDLLKAARKSRETGILDKLIPTDHTVFRWLEAPDAEKLKLAQTMTAEELKAATYIRDWYADARDYLVQHEVLKKYRSDYITHIRRGFLEAWKEEGGSTIGMVSGEKKGPVARAAGGLLAAMKEAFSQYKLDAAYFNILDQKTDQVLPLEKFFQFSMKRTGELKPTQNVAKAFGKYVETFERKRALDSIVPKLDIYVHSLTPKKLTPRGLEFDDSLKRFFKAWMNTKKGRPINLGIFSPGDPLDWGLRTGIALTRIIDLGGSIPVGIVSNVGAQLAVYRGLGEKAYAIGQARLLSGKGKEILSKYKNLVGEPLHKKITSADSSVGENLMTGLFGLFSFADRKAREVFLLGSMTPEEFAKGAVSPDRLVDIKLALGRQLPLEGAESIIGKTALGKAGSQYKGWAIPLLSSTLDDATKLYHAVKEGDKAYLKTPEFAELMRTVIVSAVVGLGAYGIVSDKTPMKDRSFTDKIAVKAAQDALSFIGVLDPTLWSATPRLLQFLYDLSTALKQIVLIQKNQQGDLSGVTKFEQTLTPGVVKQVLPPATAKKKSATPGLPHLPALPKLPKLPKAPGIRR